MKNGLMMAIALDEDYDNLNAISEEITAFLNEATNSTYETPDNIYTVYVWHFWGLTEQGYYDLRAYLDTVRHRYVEFTEDGEIVTDNKDSDEFGVDEEFSNCEMLSVKPCVQFFGSTFEED